MTGLPFASLFAPESQRDVLESLNSASKSGRTRKGRDVIGRRRDGGLVPLFMTMSQDDDGGDKLCAIFRDMTSWKKTEGDFSTPSARRKRRHQRNPISSPRSATRSEHRSTPSSAFPK